MKKKYLKNYFDKVLMFGLCMSLGVSTTAITTFATEENVMKEVVDEQEDFGIANLVVSGSSVEVEYTTAADCTILVGFYTEDGKQMYTSIKTDAVAGNNAVQMNLETELPEQYLMKAFMLDKEQTYPLAEAYTDSVTSGAVEVPVVSGAVVDADKIVSGVTVDVTRQEYKATSSFEAYEGEIPTGSAVFTKNTLVDSSYIVALVKDKDAEDVLAVSNLLFIDQYMADQKLVYTVTSEDDSVDIENISEHVVFLANPQSGIESGDVDESGEVDLQDANAVLKIALGITSVDGRTEYIADINRSGSVTYEDAEYALKMALGVTDLVIVYPV